MRQTVHFQVGGDDERHAHVPRHEGKFTYLNCLIGLLGLLGCNTRSYTLYHMYITCNGTCTNTNTHMFPYKDGVERLHQP